MDNLLDKFTSHFKRILIQAQNIAWQEQSSSIEPLHLFEALLQQKGCIGVEIMQKQNITLQTATFRSPERLNTHPRHDGPNDFWNLPQPSHQSQHIIENAVKISLAHQHKYVGSEHLLHGLITTHDVKIVMLLKNNGVNTKGLMDQLETVLKSTSKFNSMQPDVSDTREREIEQAFDSKETALDSYTTDLTAAATQKTIDPVIGRSKEIDRLVQILSRRTKNNPVLLGDPGVGKTAIIEGLAKKIAEGNVPDVLLDKKIVSLDLSGVLAGTMYRGEFESRLKQIIDEVQQDENIILFIDEIHNIIGAGSSTGSLDAANILKPALSRGQLRCIGATTYEEYKKFIESDKALERRFQVIMVDEASDAETLEILKGIRQNYENFHHVTITDEALNTAVRLSKRYITDKKMPDKAIDLIDEAASRLKVEKKISSKSKRIRELDHNLHEIQHQKRDFILNEEYSKALNLKDQEDIILQELDGLKAEQKKQDARILGIIAETNIASIVAQATGIPLTELLSSEKRRLANLEKSLSEHVFGQDEAIKEVSQTIRRSRAGLSDPRKPLGSFMFLGPSGVGKTETARQLAKFLFNREDALIRIDMSEFAERFNVSKLIGAPAGYVGYKETTTLSDAVRRKPYSVVLFDEVEKAHPDVFNLLLPVLEDGYLTDAGGKRIDFKNTIIIMTSNIGLREFTQTARVGFSLGDDETTENFAALSEQITKSLKDYFRPEFLNRLDKVVIFKPLNAAIAKKVILREIERVNERLAVANQHTVTVTPAALQLIIDQFKPAEGARSLHRAVQTMLVDPLANKLLASATKDKSIVTVDAAEKKIVFS